MNSTNFINNPLIVIPQQGPYSFQGDLKDDPNQYLDGVYLHGKVETDAGYDCIGFVNLCPDIERVNSCLHVPKDLLDDGIYPCKLSFNDKPCTMFYWKQISYHGINEDKEIFISHRGLIVYDQDLKSRDYAFNKYILKEITL